MVGAGCERREAAAAMAGARSQPVALHASSTRQSSARGTSAMATTLAACRTLPQCTTGV